MTEHAHNLSPQDRAALELTYTFLEGLTAFLESAEKKLTPDERDMGKSLRELAALCRDKLKEAFPELHSWLREMGSGGVA